MYNLYSLMSSEVQRIGLNAVNVGMRSQLTLGVNDDTSTLDCIDTTYPMGSILRTSMDLLVPTWWQQN